MGKATIIEAQNSETVFEQGNNKGILGKLKGVFADYKHGTRNSDRLYSEELWDNRVFGSEDVMEALETKTLFGELDHPEGDRCETLAKNAAISITKLEKRPEEGVIYGEAEILDTPTGRIVKALADSGAKLGVSSRGMGEEIFVDGQNIIDPETYDFITFDVVVTPANTKARVELTESKKISLLTENLKKEIKEAETENQLNQIRNVVESINVSNKNELVEMVENKLNAFNKEIPNKLTEANKNIALKLLKQKYEESKGQLEEALSQNNQLADENAKLLDENKFLKTSRNNIRIKLGESRKLESKPMSDVLFKNACDDIWYGYSFKSFVDFERERGTAEGYTDEELKAIWDKAVEYMSKDENKTLQNKTKSQLDEANKTISNLSNQLKMESAKHKEMLLKSRQVANQKSELNSSKLNDTIKELTEAVNTKQEKIDKLIESNKMKQDKINTYAKVMLENKALKEKVLKLENAQKANQAKLTESKLQETKKIRALENKVRELENANAKMEEARERFSKLAFDPVGTVKAVAENFNTSDYSQDDIDLYNALIGNK